MGRPVGVILIILFTSNAFGIALFNGLFDGLQKGAEYKSDIPCESGVQKDCDATVGPMGHALDKASSVGLDIKKIIVRSEDKSNKDRAIFVETAQSGTCYVNPNEKDTMALKFTCSSSGLVNNKLQSIDKIVLLKKDSNDQFVLEDITQKQNMTR